MEKMEREKRVNTCAIMKLSGFSISFSLWTWVKSTVETDFMLKVSVVRLWSVWASGLAGSLQHVNIGHERKTTALHSCSTASPFILDVLNHWLGYYFFSFFFSLQMEVMVSMMGCMLREDKLFSDDPEKLRFQKLVCRDSLPGHVTVRSFAQTVPLSETIHSTLSSLCVLWIWQVIICGSGLLYLLHTFCRHIGTPILLLQ